MKESACVDRIRRSAFWVWLGRDVSTVPGRRVAGCSSCLRLPHAQAARCPVSPAERRSHCFCSRYSPGPACGNTAARCATAASQGSQRIFPLSAAAVEGGVGEAGRFRPSPGARLTGTVASSHPVSPECRHSWKDREGRLHRRKGVLRECPRAVCHGESVSSQECAGGGPGRAVRPRPLAGRPAVGGDRGESPEGNRDRCRAFRKRGPQPVSVDVRATRPHGLRRLAVGHAE